MNIVVKEKQLSKTKAIIYAFLAALFYSINVPVSKRLMVQVGPTTMAALLYLGAGIGIAVLSVLAERGRRESLDRRDLPYTLGMILLDIVAPIFLMLGIRYGSSANASLLGNFEIVVTTMIALLVFKESVSWQLWWAIGLVTLSSVVLSFEGNNTFDFSYGSLFVLLATVCWGLENNCTRKISSKDTYEIIMLKGIFSGLGAMGVATLQQEIIPEIQFIIAGLILGFVSYGLSIFLYVKAQSVIGAAKTSAYYAVAPFFGAFLSFVFLKERMTESYLVALLLMIAGTAMVIADTLKYRHEHGHQHAFRHFHDGYWHEHIINHSHSHNHYIAQIKHGHYHALMELERNHFPHI